MKRLNEEDINTGQRYDTLYFGDRTNELMPYKDIANLLSILNPRGKVWDVGCGLGRYFPYFLGSFIYGTELSTECLISLEKEYPYFPLIRWSLGEPLPRGWNNFDLVWCGEVMEHVLDPQLLIDTVYNSLRPGGVAVFSTPFQDSIICPEHIWAFDRNDIETLFSKFSGKSVFRLSNEPVDRWEHFLIVLRK